MTKLILALKETLIHREEEGMKTLETELHNVSDDELTLISDADKSNLTETTNLSLHWDEMTTFYSLHENNEISPSFSSTPMPKNCNEQRLPRHSIPNPKNTAHERDTLENSSHPSKPNPRIKKVKGIPLNALVLPNLAYEDTYNYVVSNKTYNNEMFYKILGFINIHTKQLKRISAEKEDTDYFDIPTALLKKYQLLSNIISKKGKYFLLSKKTFNEKKLQETISVKEFIKNQSVSDINSFPSCFLVCLNLTYGFYNRYRLITFGESFYYKEKNYRKIIAIINKETNKVSKLGNKNKEICHQPVLNSLIKKNKFPSELALTLEKEIYLCFDSLQTTYLKSTVTLDNFKKNPTLTQRNPVSHSDTLVSLDLKHGSSNEYRYIFSNKPFDDKEKEYQEILGIIHAQTKKIKYVGRGKGSLRPRRIFLNLTKKNNIPPASILKIPGRVFLCFNDKEAAHLKPTMKLEEFKEKLTEEDSFDVFSIEAHVYPDLRYGNNKEFSYIILDKEETFDKKKFQGIYGVINLDTKEIKKIGSKLGIRLDLLKKNLLSCQEIPEESRYFKRGALYISTGFLKNIKAEPLKKFKNKRKRNNRSQLNNDTLFLKKRRRLNPTPLSQNYMA